MYPVGVLYANNNFPSIIYARCHHSLASRLSPPPARGKQRETGRIRRRIACRWSRFPLYEHTEALLTTLTPERIKPEQTDGALQPVAAVRAAHIGAPTPWTP